MQFQNFCRVRKTLSVLDEKSGDTVWSKFINLLSSFQLLRKKGTEHTQNRSCQQPNIFCPSRPTGYIFLVIFSYGLKIKPNPRYTLGITPKRVTSGGVHLHGLALGLRSSEETSQRW